MGDNICAECGHKNRAGAMICENCGAMLEALIEARKTSSTIQFAFPPDELKNELESPDILLLTVKRAIGQPPIVLNMSEGEFIVGRSETGVRVDVDLAPYNASRYGVSRRHARIFYLESHWMVEDLGSTNGTYINHRRVQQGTPHIIHTGDEIIFGRMIVTAFFATKDIP